MSFSHHSDPTPHFFSKSENSKFQETSNTTNCYIHVQVSQKNVTGSK